jgi:hypothetical protein
MGLREEESKLVSKKVPDKNSSNRVVEPLLFMELDNSLSDINKVSIYC